MMDLREEQIVLRKMWKEESDEREEKQRREREEQERREREEQQRKEKDREKARRKQQEEEERKRKEEERKKKEELEQKKRAALANKGKFLKRGRELSFSDCDEPCEVPPVTDVKANDQEKKLSAAASTNVATASTAPVGNVVILGSEENEKVPTKQDEKVPINESGVGDKIPTKSPDARDGPHQDHGDEIYDENDYEGKLNRQIEFATQFQEVMFIKNARVPVLKAKLYVPHSVLGGCSTLVESDDGDWRGGGIRKTQVNCERDGGFYMNIDIVFESRHGRYNTELLEEYARICGLSCPSLILPSRSPRSAASSDAPMSLIEDHVSPSSSSNSSSSEPPASSTEYEKTLDSALFDNPLFLLCGLVRRWFRMHDLAGGHRGKLSGFMVNVLCVRDV
jgi:hypothetical protein